MVGVKRFCDSTVQRFNRFFESDRAAGGLKAIKQLRSPQILRFMPEPYRRFEMARLIEKLRLEREEILAIATRYHADNIRLFGSVARGEDRSDSDVDFLVDFQPGSTLLDQVALIDALSNKIGRKVDVVSSRALNRHLSQKIQQEAVAL
jgi:hypothetical protein